MKRLKRKIVVRYFKESVSLNQQAAKENYLADILKV